MIALSYLAIFFYSLDLLLLLVLEPAHGLLVHTVDVHGFCRPEGTLDWQGRTSLGLGQCWEQTGVGLGFAREESRPALGCMDLGRTSLEAVQLALAHFRSCNWTLKVG